MMAKVSNSVNTTFTTKRKKVVGDKSGKVMVQNRLNGPAPSMAAASRRLVGMDCSPAKKNKKL